MPREVMTAREVIAALADLDETSLVYMARGGIPVPVARVILGERMAVLAPQEKTPKPMSDRDDEPADDSHVRYCQQTADEHGLVDSIWSIEGTMTMFSEPHVFPGATTLLYKTPDNEPIDAPIEGPTWLDMWKGRDLAIRRSQDTHHLYIEGFHFDEDDPSCVRLETGSLLRPNHDRRDGRLSHTSDGNDKRILA